MLGFRENSIPPKKIIWESNKLLKLLGKFYISFIFNVLWTENLKITNKINYIPMFSKKLSNNISFLIPK